MPYFFDKWHGTFYMSSRTDTAGHNKALDNSNLGPTGGGQSALAQGRYKAQVMTN